MIGKPVTKFNHQSIQRHSSVLNRHRPLFRSLRNGQVNYLARRVVTGENLAAFRGRANDAVQGFNGSGRINRFADFRRVFIERALGGELSHHLGYPPGAPKPDSESNQRNGSSAKMVLTEEGPLRLDILRDRDGSFEPTLIPKHERRFTGFDDKVIAIYARGITMREIQSFPLESYGVKVSPKFISFCFSFAKFCCFLFNYKLSKNF